MLKYDRKDILAGTGINKASTSAQCGSCHCCYFLDKSFKYQPYPGNGCHDLMQKAMNFNDIAVASAK